MSMDASESTQAQLTDGTTSDETDDNRDGDGLGRGAERDLTRPSVGASKSKCLESAYTTDEHNRLETLAEYRDEREEEQRPLATPALPVVPLQRPVLGSVMRDRLGMRVLECRSELDAPLDSGAVHAEECDSHEEDDDSGEDTEGAFPDLLSRGPEVDELGVELRGVSERGWKGGVGRGIAGLGDGGVGPSQIKKEQRGVGSAGAITCTKNQVALTTAMNAAPIDRAMMNPEIVPAQIWIRILLTSFRTRLLVSSSLVDSTSRPSPSPRDESC